jgi:hypothetical protein
LERIMISVFIYSCGPPCLRKTGQRKQSKVNNRLPPLLSGAVIVGPTMHPDPSSSPLSQRTFDVF